MLKKSDRKQAERLEALENERSRMRLEIAQLREKIARTVDKGIDADDLDRKILAADYECLCMELDARREHFNDIGNIIAQMRAERLKEQEAQMLRQMEIFSDGIDYEAMARNQDYIAACRELVREERENTQALSGELTSSTFGCPTDMEFMREIARAREARTVKAASLSANAEDEK